VGRRDADAPAPGHPSRSDEAAARGRPRVGGAARGALGVGSSDLRPVRLRPRSCEPAHEVESRALPPARGAGLERPYSPRRRERGAATVPAALRARAAAPRRDADSGRALVEGASACRPGELAARREQEAVRPRRGRRRARGVRVLPGQGRLAGRIREERGARARGDRDDPARRAWALEVPARARSDRPRGGLPVRLRLFVTAGRPRSAGAQPALERRSLAAARRRRGRAASALVPARALGRARGARRALRLE
jgi:hypothetical protein